MEGWGVGDTHFTGSHIGGIHISLGICVRGYTYHGDTHITVTSVTRELFGAQAFSVLFLEGVRFPSQEMKQECTQFSLF